MVLYGYLGLLSTLVFYQSIEVNQYKIYYCNLSLIVKFIKNITVVNHGMLRMCK